MTLFADLANLFDRLRAAGLAVGVTEVERVGKVLGFEARFDEERLRRIVSSIMAKSDRQTEVVERIFGEWWEAGARQVAARIPARSLGRPRSVPELEPSRPRLKLATDSGRRPHQRVRISRRTVGLLAVAVALELSLFGWVWPNHAIDDGGVSRAVLRADGETFTPVQQSAQFELRQNSSGPALVVPPRPGLSDHRATHWLGVGLALLIGAGLWLRYARQSWLPRPAPLATRPGPSRVLLRGDLGAVPPLVSKDDEDVLVWGVEHFVAEEVGDQLDLPASVASTARHGGRPAIEYRRQRYPREIWLWLDIETEDSLLSSLVAELKASLNGAGLVVERARFAGVPDQLTADDGRRLMPAELEERRESAIVAIFTDGRGIERALRSARERRSTETLLKLLSFWPRLALVGATKRLQSTVRGHDIEVLEPPQVAVFLGGGRVGHRKTRSHEDLLPIAAICALIDQPVDSPTIHALALELGLDLSPWSDGLRRGRRLAPSPDDRVALLDWLSGRDQHPENQLARGSLLSRGLEAWERRLDWEEKRRRASESEMPWAETPAEQRLEVDRALLALWRKPEQATEALYALFLAGHQRTIRRALRQLAPADAHEGSAIRLPWRREVLPPRHQVMLREMSFGQSAQVWLPKSLRRPARLRAALALCGGLVAGGVLALSVWRQDLTPAPAAGREATAPIDGSILVYVPGGEYPQGADDSEWGDERPAHTVTLSPFWINKTEVTNAQYRRYLEEWQAEMPPKIRLPEPRYLSGPRYSADPQPVVGIGWQEARGYCLWAGMDLPTEAQWEAAARGADGRKYPWGNLEPSAILANFDVDTSWEEPTPVGRYPDGMGPFGTLDQAGNVWEWVLDPWDEHAYQNRGSGPNPIATANGSVRVLRGGAWGFMAEDLRSARRYWSRSTVRLSHFGFRCAARIS